MKPLTISWHNWLGSGKSASPGGIVQLGRQNEAFSGETTTYTLLTQSGE
jgi:hypothetical protein